MLGQQHDGAPQHQQAAQNGFEPDHVQVWQQQHAERNVHPSTQPSHHGHAARGHQRSPAGTAARPRIGLRHRTNVSDLGHDRPEAHRVVPTGAAHGGPPALGIQIGAKAFAVGRVDGT